MKIKTILPWLKLGVGVLLMVLIWQELDPTLMDQVESRWGDFARYFVAGMALYLVTFSCSILRWNLLLNAFGVAHRVSDTFRIGWIGLLFSQVIPGATGGDLVKGYYAAKESPSQRVEAVLSVILDRVVGLLGLMLLGGVAFALQWNSVQQNELLQKLFWVLVGAAIMVGGGVALVTWERLWSYSWLRHHIRRLPGTGFLSILLRALSSVRRKKKLLLTALALSLLIHTFMIGIHVLMARALNGVWPPVGTFFFLLPVGMLANALPLSPGGLGVGEAAYHQLFQGSGLTHGAELAILMRLTTLLFALVGLYYYLRGRKEIQQVVRATEEQGVDLTD